MVDRGYSHLSIAKTEGFASKLACTCSWQVGAHSWWTSPWAVEGSQNMTIVFPHSRSPQGKQGENGIMSYKLAVQVALHHILIVYGRATNPDTGWRGLHKV